MAHIWVILSALSGVIKLGPFTHEVVACVRNHFSSFCITVDNMASQMASSNHSCVCHLNIELPLSASVMLVYQNLLNPGKMEFSWHSTR